jgi:hypothetical protein
VELSGVFASGALVQIIHLIGDGCERSEMNLEVAFAQELLRDGESHVALAQLAVCQEQDVPSRRSHDDRPKKQRFDKRNKGASQILLRGQTQFKLVVKDEIMIAPQVE